MNVYQILYLYCVVQRQVNFWFAFILRERDKELYLNKNVVTVQAIFDKHKLGKPFL